MRKLPTELASLEDPISVGVIGSGLFGTNVIDQVERIPGMTTAVVADVDTDKAVDTLGKAGVSEESIATVSSPAAANETMDAGSRAVLSDGVALTRTDVEVVVEATGLPNPAARHAYSAIDHGKHVVMATVEAGTVVGPALTRLADNAGVTYAMAYGDQPALVVEICDWAESIGLDIVAAGKGNDRKMTPEFFHGTPDDVFDRLGKDPDMVDDLGLNPKMYNSFADGTKAAVEMCAVANATGLRPDVHGMHLPTAGIPEIVEKLRPTEDGGILEDTGAIETVAGVGPDGAVVEHNLGFGVFVVTKTDNPRLQQYFADNTGPGVFTASDGKYQVFYRHHHLPGIETPVSIAEAALHNQATGAPREHVTEVAAAAKRDLEPGEELDGGGGYTIYGLLEDASTADRNDHVPFELLGGAEVVSPIGEDDIVTYDDVSLDDETFIYHLRQVQDSF